MTLRDQRLLARRVGYDQGRAVFAAVCDPSRPARHLAARVGYDQGRAVFALAEDHTPAGLGVQALGRYAARRVGYDQGRAVFALASCSQVAGSGSGGSGSRGSVAGSVGSSVASGSRPGSNVIASPSWSASVVSGSAGSGSQAAGPTICNCHAGMALNLYVHLSGLTNGTCTGCSNANRLYGMGKQTWFGAECTWLLQGVWSFGCGENADFAAVYYDGTILRFTLGLMMPSGQNQIVGIWEKTLTSYDCSSDQTLDLVTDGGKCGNLPSTVLVKNTIY